MNNQEAFNKCVAGLASQGFEKCIDEFGECRLTKGDMHCAVGWLVPDATSVGAVIDSLPEFSTLSSLPAFLDRLLSAHDYSNSPGDMKMRLIEVALDFNLDIPDVLN